jgi:hypothetical protein
MPMTAAAGTRKRNGFIATKIAQQSKNANVFFLLDKCSLFVQSPRPLP